EGLRQAPPAWQGERRTGVACAGATDRQTRGLSLTVPECRCRLPWHGKTAPRPGVVVARSSVRRQQLASAFRVAGRGSGVRSTCRLARRLPAVSAGARGRVRGGVVGARWVGGGRCIVLLPQCVGGTRTCRGDEYQPGPLALLALFFLGGLLRLAECYLEVLLGALEVLLTLPA